MSDTVTQTFNAEPDETVLTNALRNQDDIPILMDIVGTQDVKATQQTASSKKKEQTPSAVYSEDSVLDIESKNVEKASPALKISSSEKEAANSPLSQEDYFSLSMDDGDTQTPLAAIDEQQDDEQRDRAHLEAAIQTVLEQRLPSLITDVLIEYTKRKG
ncbi:hypothetical protein [Marinomonas balearica]|uniref:Uncharacterized protein n=1 Tax=Marinomonas balearica TaxID=491947 RepID=A0A4R6M457_9GAMM|nr:hypothetical protein [Marinomonas balearica]TDO95475.1 hypothetical protein DFP79_3404 [Marinomonas balearica]